MEAETFRNSISGALVRAAVIGRSLLGSFERLRKSREQISIVRDNGEFAPATSRPRSGTLSTQYTISNSLPAPVDSNDCVSSKCGGQREYQQGLDALHG